MGKKPATYDVVEHVLERADLRHHLTSTNRFPSREDEPKVRISSSGVVLLPPAEVFAFLVDVRNHWQLASSEVQVLELAHAPGVPDRGVFVIRGPLGIRRRVRTTVLESSDASGLRGIARVGSHTVVDVRWELYQHEANGTCVVLAADVRSIGFTDGLLLALGGRIWMRRLFAATIEHLSLRLSIAANTQV